MADNLYQMTPAELEIVSAGASDPNIFFDYWFRKPGQEKGWQLDGNFTDDGKWQVDMCMALQSFIVAICGIATGKTLGVVMSAGYHGVLTDGFKFLNVAKEGWQSELMYKAFLEQAQDTLFEKLIVSKPKRPYPTIVISYKVGDAIIRSTMEFMSLGEAGDASNIFSWRGDWINIEEAGRIDNIGEIVGTLATRLTGVTASGRPFLGRMSVISNPWDNYDLWQLQDLALEDLEDGLVFNINTTANKNVTDKQVRIALKLIPKEDHARFMTGARPKGRGEYFSEATVTACESSLLSEAAIAEWKDGKGETIIHRAKALHVFHYRKQRQDGRVYFNLSDPGTGTAPARNAPVIMTFDVTEAPKFVPIVSLWWGSGGGSIMPWVDKKLEWIRYYQPLFAGCDSTATQKNTAEMVNLDHVYGRGLSVDSITGLDFSGPKRYSYLVALRMCLESKMFAWPDFLVGISSQLLNYDDRKDKAQNSKLPQDIVATMAMAAFSIRSHYSLFDEEDSREVDTDGPLSFRSLKRNSIRSRRSDAGRSKGEKVYRTGPR